MRITEVRVKLATNEHDRLKAFCTMTFDNAFVVRDIKVIENVKGYFVAMPSRKVSSCCARCGGKNHIRASFCNRCGGPLPRLPAPKDDQGKDRFHMDIAHPINAQCREQIQQRVVNAFREEVKRSKEPGYRPAEIDEPDDDVPEVER